MTAYAVALAASGVQVREHVRFTGLQTAGGRVTGVRTAAGPVSAPLVVLTGGPELAEVGALAGVRIPAGGVRHQVAVTEPHPDLDPARLPMVFDLAAGLYWRPEEGGLLFGMSNPDEPPGPAAAVDEPYLARMRQRLAELVPVTAGLGLRRIWAATIDYTPDHLPIIGPAIAADGADRRRHRGRRRRGRDDVGARRGPRRRGRRPDRHLRRDRRDRPRPGPVRRERRQQAGAPTRSPCPSRGRGAVR